MTHPIQHIGNTINLVMMDVEEGHEAEFDRWYNEEHLPERMEIPGYVSARRFKLEEGNGVLKYLCIWEVGDASPLQSEMYKSQRARPAGFARRPTSTSRSEPGACTNKSTRWKGPSRITPVPTPSLWPPDQPEVSPGDSWRATFFYIVFLMLGPRAHGVGSAAGHRREGGRRRHLDRSGGRPSADDRSQRCRRTGRG